MPVRSSVCAYSPATAASLSSGATAGKYSSSLLPSSGPLSVGHYKPLASFSSTFVGSPRSTSSSSSTTSSYTSPRSGRYTAAYSPTSSISSYSSLGSNHSAASSSSYSPSSTTSTSTTSSTSLASYRPLASSFSGSSRYVSPSTLTPTTPATAYSRYSSASSTASSLSSVSSTTGYSSGATYTSGHYPSAASLRRRLSSSSTQQCDSPLPSGVPRGLVNLGNTCYMNAVLQSLYSLEPFRQLVLTKAPASAYSSQDKPLTGELAQLFKQIQSSPQPVSPSSFKCAFARHQAKFAGLGQQDAQEFLRYLVNGLHEEWNKAARRPRRQAPPRAPKTADEAWQQYREIVDDSPLVDLLVGQMCSTIVCGQCQSKSACWDPFWDLSLPLARHRHTCRLAEVIEDFIARETLDGDERPVCSHCKRPTRSTKQIELSRLPPVLILHLKKFTNDGYKLTTPEVKIDATLSFSPAGAHYQLAAAISHHGHSSSSGHYTSHGRFNSSWFHFNDDRARDVTGSFDPVKLTDAYVLFYTQSTNHHHQSKL